MYMTMVLMVLGIQSVIEKACVKEYGKVTNEIINYFIWRDGAVHGIMSSDKQTCIEVHLNENHQVNQRIIPGKVPAQEEEERSEP